MHRLKVFADDKHPYADNIAKNHEHREYQDDSLNRKLWSESSGVELKQTHDEMMRGRIQQMID